MTTSASSPGVNEPSRTNEDGQARWAPAPATSMSIQRLEAGAGLKALESLSLEHPGQRPSDRGLVVHDEAIGKAGHDRLRVQSTGHG